MFRSVRSAGLAVISCYASATVKRIKIIRPNMPELYLSWKQSPNDYEQVKPGKEAHLPLRDWNSLRKSSETRRLFLSLRSLCRRVDNFRRDANTDVEGELPRRVNIEKYKTRNG